MCYYDLSKYYPGCEDPNALIQPCNEAAESGENCIAQRAATLGLQMTHQRRTRKINRYRLELDYVPCSSPHCCLTAGHSTPHRVWMNICTSPECTLLAGHPQPHSSLAPCHVDGCGLSAGHSHDHIETPPTLRELAELAVANTKTVMQQFLQLDRKVLDTMGVSNPALQTSNQSLLGQLVMALMIANPSTPIWTGAPPHHYNLDQRLDLHAAAAKLASIRDTERMEHAKNLLREEKAKRAERRLKRSTDSGTSVLPEPPNLAMVVANADANVPQTQAASLYLGLDFSSHEIRLFELYPDQGTGDLRGSFRQADLLSCPAYTALSYAWGDETELKHIKFDNNTTLGIRGNLWSFLRGQSTLIVEPTLFWIDAICINQTNINERNHQVNLMGRIYAKASCVYVWLGPEADGSDLAMDFLVQRAKRKLRSRGQGFNKFWSTQEGKALVHLCERSYWRRMWIIQEIIYAEKITVWCGTKRCDWSAAESLYLTMKSLEDENWFAHHDFVIPVLQSSASVMIWQRAHWRHPDTPIPRLQTLVDIFRDWQCTDIRDKVYALVGMANTDTAIIPDYSRSAIQVYYDVLHKDATHKPKFGDTLSQILGLPARELHLPGHELIEYKRQPPEMLVLKARMQSEPEGDDD